MELTSIQKRIQIIEGLQKELQVLSNMLKETYENDPQFQKAEEENSKVREETKVAKNKVEEKESVKKILTDMKEKRDDIKEAQETLSLELIEYYRKNSVLTVEDGDGKVREMKISVKLSNPK
ncbi:MAG: hypothetical protein AAB443_04475 [Patescibacteria group bacterium]